MRQTAGSPKAVWIKVKEKGRKLERNTDRKTTGQTRTWTNRRPGWSLLPYLFGWAEKCSGSCETCPPWPAFWHQCWSASSCRQCLLCPPPCLIGCRPSSPGYTCRRWCLCSWSCSCRWRSPSACFSFWMQSHCQPPPLSLGHVRAGREGPEERMEGGGKMRGEETRKEFRYRSSWLTVRLSLSQNVPLLRLAH